MEKITSNRSIQLTLPENSTVIVIQRKNQTALEKPSIKFPEERSIHPTTVLALMEDFNRYGLDELDINGRESKMYTDLRKTRDASVGLSEVMEDISATIDEAPIEGKKFASTPRRVRDFGRHIGAMVEEVWTEPRQKTG